MSASVITCDVCGRTVGTSKGDAGGWVMWFRDRSDMIVKSFGVYCQVPCATRIENRKPEGWAQLDHHLYTFTGRNALPRFAGLMLDYRWSKEALTRCTEFFVVAQRLPFEKKDSAGMKAFWAEAELGGHG